MGETQPTLKLKFVNKLVDNFILMLPTLMLPMADVWKAAIGKQHNFCDVIRKLGCDWLVF